MDPAESHEHRYDWIFDNLSNVVRRFAQNPGILACLFGLAGDYAEFDQIWKENAHRWNLRVAEYLRRELGCDAAHARRMGFVLGAMTEGVVYQALIRQHGGPGRDGRQAGGHRDRPRGDVVSGDLPRGSAARAASRRRAAPDRSRVEVGARRRTR